MWGVITNQQSVLDLVIADVPRLQPDMNFTVSLNISADVAHYVFALEDSCCSANHASPRLVCCLSPA